MAYKRRHKSGRVFPKGRKIYAKFQYLGEPIEYATGEFDTPENHEYWEEWLDDALDAIANGSFVYAKVFPTANQKKKALFARLESKSVKGRKPKACPETVTLGEVIIYYQKKIVPRLTTQSNREAHNSKINSRIKPYLGELTFSGFDRSEVGEFISWLAGSDEVRQLDIPGNKKSLKRQTILDTITVLREIWNEGCEKYNFSIRDPFRKYTKFIPEDPIDEAEDSLNPAPPVWRFGEVLKILAEINKMFLNVTIFMFLTGLSASEIAGIRTKDIQGGELLIRNFVPRRQPSKKRGKTRYRRRAIPITKAIRKCLDTALETFSDREAEEGNEDYLFLSKEGKHFSCSIYYENWVGAVKRAGLSYKRPYSTRQTFAAWSLVLGKQPTELVKNMGHGSKKMVYEEYGEWAKGLGEDKNKIRKFMGDDY